MPVRRAPASRKSSCSTAVCRHLRPWATRRRWYRHGSWTRRAPMSRWWCKGALAMTACPMARCRCAGACSERRKGGDAVFADAAALQTSVRFTRAGHYILRLAANDGALMGHADVQVSAPASRPLQSLPLQAMAGVSAQLTGMQYRVQALNDGFIRRQVASPVAACAGAAMGSTSRQRCGCSISGRARCGCPPVRSTCGTTSPTAESPRLPAGSCRCCRTDVGRTSSARAATRLRQRRPARRAPPALRRWSPPRCAWC